MHSSFCLDCGLSLSANYIFSCPHSAPVYLQLGKSRIFLHRFEFDTVVLLGGTEIAEADSSLVRVPN